MRHNISPSPNQMTPQSPVSPYKFGPQAPNDTPYIISRSEYQGMNHPTEAIPALGGSAITGVNSEATGQSPYSAVHDPAKVRTGRGFSSEDIGWSSGVFGDVVTDPVTGERRNAFMTKTLRGLGPDGSPIFSTQEVSPNQATAIISESASQPVEGFGPMGSLEARQSAPQRQPAEATPRRAEAARQDRADEEVEPDNPYADPFSLPRIERPTYQQPETDDAWQDGDVLDTARSSSSRNASSAVPDNNGKKVLFTPPGARAAAEAMARLNAGQDLEPAHSGHSPLAGGDIGSGRAVQVNSTSEAPLSDQVRPHRKKVYEGGGF